MRRKEFIQKSLSAGLVVATGGFPVEAFAKGDIQKVTILHTNDQHSRIEPFPMDGSKYQGLGGFAQRSHLIQQIRQQEKNVLLLDSGDIWQGTPYFNLFGGALEYQLMNDMKYDASTLGNHDFDAGIEGLVKHMPVLNFPFLNANYDFSDSELQGKIKPYKIFKLDEIKVGVLGLGIELEGLVPKSAFNQIRYRDPLPIANRIATELKHEHHCDLVICLSHLGFKYDDKKVSDEQLAYATHDIDLILGGHTHTFFYRPEEYINAAGKKVLINQVGWAGIFLGRIDFYFEQKNRKAVLSSGPIPVLKK